MNVILFYLYRTPDMKLLLVLIATLVALTNAKVFFDNGSSAALVTHAFAKQIGLEGRMVTYWLIVVGHEKVLRETMLYTFQMEDNNGKVHKVEAFGIDQRGSVDKAWEHELNLKMTLEISYLERIGLLCALKHLPSFKSQRCLLLPF